MIVKLADEFAAIGAKHGATSGQVVLAWLLAQGPKVFVIPGTKKVKVQLSLFLHLHGTRSDCIVFFQ